MKINTVLPNSYVRKEVTNSGKADWQPAKEGKNRAILQC